MKKEEAKKIYKDWKEYIEIGEKLSRIFIVVPKYFLPYPIKTLEEALNIIAKEYFDAGDKQMAKNIQETMVLHMGGYYLTQSHTEMTDEEVFENMKKQLDFILVNAKLREAVIKNLKESQESWIKFRNSKEFERY